MTAWYLLNPVIRGILLMLLYLFLLIQMGCVLAAFGMARRRKAVRMIPGFVFTGLFLCVLCGANYVIERQVGSNDKMAVLVCFPSEAAVALVLVLGIWAGQSLYRIYQDYRDTITESAIKESIDNLPSGLSFSEENGFILLANRRMEALCRELTGRDFQDAKVFWEDINSGTVLSGTPDWSCGPSPVFQLADGTVWMFERKTLTAEEQTVVQITAADMTKLYHLAVSLQENSRKLSEMNEQLKQYGENIENYVRSREVLEAKMRIHDEMGQVLLASRSWLQKHGTVQEKEELLHRWRKVIILFRREGEPQNTGKNWKYFMDAAEFAGVKIRMEGNFVQQGQNSHLLIAAAAEALTNAVRHAGADEMTIQIDRENREITTVFTNNGKAPEKEISEGGGLGALRLRVEAVRGRMCMEAFPRFALTVVLPEEVFCQ